jgi:RsiW-degrading membrane proteinase PrsW (M82 family)
METFAALTIAVVGTGLPTAAYVGLVWWLDRYEKEPVWLLALAFAWGAVPAAILSLVLEMAIDLPIAALGGDSLAAQLLSYGLGAPLVEESVKSIALVALVLLFPQEFDSLLDGIIYGAMIGLGFSMTETAVAYTLPILLQSGLGPGLVNLLWRAVFFGLNHAFWTAVTGAGMAYARLEARPASWVGGPAAAWGLAVLLHGLHNVGAILTEPAFCLPLSLSLVVDWGGLLALGILAILILRRERIWIAQGLADEVHQGTLSEAELTLLCSATRRGIVRWQALARGGMHAFWAIGRYSQSATELAFRKRHLPATQDPTRLQHLEQLRLSLAARRAEALPWLNLFSE